MCLSMQQNRFLAVLFLMSVIALQALAYAEPLEQATARHARAWKVGANAWLPQHQTRNKYLA